MAKAWGITQDSQGNAIVGVTVKVYTDAAATLLATIYSDSALTVPIDQVASPVTTDSKGHYQAYMAPGTYTIVGTKGTYSFTEQNVDVGFSVPTSRLISTTAPLTGGGDLSANRTLGFDAFEDVRAHGAVGDGVTDDKAAFQAAIDAAEVSGGVVYVPVPSVDWRIKSDLTINSNNVQLVGSGWGSYIVLEGARVHVDGSGGQLSGIGIGRLRIRRLNTNPGVALDFVGAGTATGPTRFHLWDLDVQGGGGSAGARVGTCLRLAGTVLGKIDNPYFHDTGKGIVIENDPVLGSFSGIENTVIAGDVTDCDTAASITNAKGLRFLGTTFQLCDTIGVDILGTCRSVKFDSCRFEDNAGHDIRVGNTASGCQDFSVRNSFFQDGSAAKDHAVTLVRATNAAINDNTFEGYAAEAVDIQEASAGAVSGRMFNNSENGTGPVATNGARLFGATTEIFCGSANPAAGAVQYASPIDSAKTSENVVSYPAPYSGIARNLRVEQPNDPGAGESMTVNFRIGNADSSLEAVVSGTATSASDLTSAPTFAAGDLLALEFAASNNGGYSGGQARASLELVLLEE